MPYYDRLLSLRAKPRHLLCALSLHAILHWLQQLQWADPGKKSKGNLKAEAVMLLTEVSGIVEVRAPNRAARVRLLRQPPPTPPHCPH